MPTSRWTRRNLATGEADASGAVAPVAPVTPAASKPPKGLLAQMRIRKKLLLLHTLFSLGLAGILVAALRPALGELVRRAEAAQARYVLRGLIDTPGALSASVDGVEGLRVLRGEASALGLTEAFAAVGASEPGVARVVPGPSSKPTLVAAYRPRVAGAGEGHWVAVSVEMRESRAAVVRLYGIVVAALLTVYALVVLTLEVFVLPRHVYGPIRSMLAADAAIQAGDRDSELVPEGAIPKDELGEIMRSRNESVRSLRRHETALAQAFSQIEEVAADLRRKNHLLERARENIAESDRLASLGMMSAGLAHELNTPLAVLKGLVERLNASSSPKLSREEAALMQRVVTRLERLGDSLLDFARARAPMWAPVSLAQVVGEAVTLVELDRGRSVAIESRVDARLEIDGDADRLIQVFVNLIRNGVDALTERGGRDGATAARIEIRSDALERDGRSWVVVRIEDNGPGIDPSVLAHLFEPFVSTRLDARGTGLGLAVAEGIVREHGGVILAKNRTDAEGGRLGAMFEVVLPARPETDGPRESA